MRRSIALCAWVVAGCTATLDLDAPTAADAGPDATTGSVDAATPDAEPVPPDAAPLGCRDADGDSYGEGCAAGPDCAEGDAARSPGAIELCNDLDDDCDGEVDETWVLDEICTVGVGQCAAMGVTACADDGLAARCDGSPGAPSAEVCNGVDDDCDGQSDERVARCCQPGEVRACGQDEGVCTLGEQICDGALTWGRCTGNGARDEACNGLDDDCDGRVDEQVTNACGGCGVVGDEVCNGRDDDCDQRVDEGVRNVCGGCGAIPREICNRADDDCDGRTDEGTTNACGTCGPLPDEACNGRDDDCDGRTDEGATNRCGACAPEPVEVCNGRDDDCDGRIDEGACHAFLLRRGAAAWATPPGLNIGGPFARGETIGAAVSLLEGGDRVWAFTNSAFWIYDPARDRWVGEVPVGTLPGLLAGAPITAGYAIPMWWGRRWAQMPVGAALTVVQGRHFSRITIHPATREVHGHAEGDIGDNWPDDPLSPAPADALTATVIDLRNAAGWWTGDPRPLCEAAVEPRLGPTLAITTAADRLFTADVGYCFRFAAQGPTAAWPGFALPGAPPVARISAWTHFEPEADDVAGFDLVFTR